MKEKYSFYDYLQEVRALPLTPMQFLTLMDKVRIYFRSVEDFKKSSTPESEALARWGIQDAEVDYNSYCRSLGVKAPPLYRLSDAVY